MERLDLSLASERDVAQEDAGDEDGQEARSVGDRREPIDDSGSTEHADGVERGSPESNMAQHGQQQHGAGDSDGEANRHLDRELLEHDRERAAVLGGELDHADHERDPHGVVRAGFALENGP